MRWLGSGLAAALLKPAKQPGRAVFVVLVERGVTFGYLIPTMLRFQRDQAVSEASIRRALARWARLNYLRNTLTLVAWVAVLKALSMAHL